MRDYGTAYVLEPNFEIADSSSHVSTLPIIYYRLGTQPAQSAFDFDPILWLVNGQGRFIAYDDDTGDAMGALISRFSLPETGIYIPAVGSKNAGIIL